MGRRFERTPLSTMHVNYCQKIRAPAGPFRNAHCREIWVFFKLISAGILGRLLACCCAQSGHRAPERSSGANRGTLSPKCEES